MMPDVTSRLLPRPRSVRLAGGSTPYREPIVKVDPSLPAQGYRLRVGEREVRVDCADPAGGSYARSTLDMLRRLGGDLLPLCAIEDWPDLAVRGVMLDVSRGKVPSLATLKDLIKRLAGWKVNQVQLYMEHTFAYSDHREVWEKADPFTAEDIVELDSFCRALHVELVPNQNCLGHMERWLQHERYRHLAVLPDGSGHPISALRGPTTLDPSKPGSLALVRELLAELLPCFTSKRVHVGLDEPFELAPSRAGEYWGYVRDLRACPEMDGREMLMWGDVVSAHPEVAGLLPDGVTICEWGYEAEHPFEDRARELAGAGRLFWLCPGTSSWLSLVGRTSNALRNCASAAEAAVRWGAQGYLVTDWGDLGHLQYLPVSEPILAYAAAVSWCSQSNRDLDLAEAIDRHVFDDASGEMGRAVLALGDACGRVTPRPSNFSPLVLHLYFPMMPVGSGPTAGLTKEDLGAVEATISDAVEALGRARPRRADGLLVLEELSTSARLLGLLCRDARARLAGDGTLPGVPKEVREDLAADLAEIADSHRRLWRARNREGGLDSSVARLERLRHAYLTLEDVPVWPQI